jgi:hypothetical protein
LRRTLIKTKTPTFQLAAESECGFEVTHTPYSLTGWLTLLPESCACTSIGRLTPASFNTREKYVPSTNLQALPHRASSGSESLIYSTGNRLSGSNPLSLKALKVESATQKKEIAKLKEQVRDLKKMLE